ncbi:MAG: methylenetetrahydrofolate--tRNA-(uracil(54)-C(5))-methyltransferase (FADH(2)-oxidizing) TrmFO [Planctomycetota bacterium]|jgi:methylenetetrahydrofolate--tRNA-(uracil-5-)-methyltransferase|nr:methylenetetrahydrofolate--tRNA-(uracil(54)-C(5))-methyltransferase (FADH(2)-oxidizing) TrmFO [Planctomycetota bacterium]
MEAVPVIGAGLAGSEAALQIASAGFDVILHEMRPVVPTAAHETDHCAELVCSNSLGSSLPDRAGGVLQAELRALNCQLLPLAESNSVPAGAALAVDRLLFGQAVTAAIEAHPRIELARGELGAIPEGNCIVASGPLTSEALAADIQRLTGAEHLAFFDAIAPVVVADSLDREVIFAAARWGNGDPDYLNIPLDKEEYEAFLDQLLAADKHELKDFEAADPRAKQFFERCLPVEVLAARGRESLRFGPMRPVGLDDPRTGRWPWAVIQMRRENTEGTVYNLVGFQTNLKYGPQQELLRSLPGMQDAEFVRLGSMHRNTFLNSPQVLNSSLEYRDRPGLFFAGQITGMEGYLGNIGSGMLAGLNMVRRLRGMEPVTPPRESLLGSLTHHVAESPSKDFQPMKAEFGLLPPLIPPVKKPLRRQAYANRSAAEIAAFGHNLGLLPTSSAHPEDHANDL